MAISRKVSDEERLIKILPGGFAMVSAQRIRKQREKAESFKKFVSFLESNGGVVLISEARKIVPESTLLRLLSEHRETLQRLHLKYARQGQGRSIGGSRFIKAEYLNKHFIALKTNRTGLVRFFMKIFKEREYLQYDAKAINQWLKSFGLSKAKRVAIITSLGYKYKWLEGMRINGWLDHKPRRLRKILAKTQ